MGPPNPLLPGSPSGNRRRAASNSPSPRRFISRRAFIIVGICVTGVFILASISQPRRSPWSPLSKGEGSSFTASDELLTGSDRQPPSRPPKVKGSTWPLGSTVEWIGGKFVSGGRWGGHSSSGDDSVHHAALQSAEKTYREHLESTTSPPSYKHSPTMTFSHIYVLSLPSRQDRRTRMKKLARALGFEFTFVDAISKNEGVIRWIGERVEEVRKKKAPIIAKHEGEEASAIGGMIVGSPWLARSDGLGARPLPFPSLKEKRWDGLHWVDYLSKHGPDGLDAREGPGFNVAQRLHDPMESTENRQVNEGSIAVWYGQTTVLRRMLENDDESALILEDDVDFEWDVERIWATVHRRLPKIDLEKKKRGWQLAFMGHCWGRELMKAQYNHPLLHQASEPRCLHGYAVTKYGAQRTLNLLSDPWIAYQTAIDIAIPTFIRDGLYGYTGAFSVDPQLIIQAKELTSDIAPGIGSPWRGVLMDSTWDRILVDEGHDVPEPVFPGNSKADPATKYRGPDVVHPELDAEAAWVKEMEENAAQRKVEQEKAREEALGREILVEGVNVPGKAPKKKLPAPAVGKQGANAAHAGGLAGPGRFKR